MFDLRILAVEIIKNFELDFYLRKSVDIDLFNQIIEMKFQSMRNQLLTMIYYNYGLQNQQINVK